jgi:hypothetical protein
VNEIDEKCNLDNGADIQREDYHCPEIDERIGQ